LSEWTIYTRLALSCDGFVLAATDVSLSKTLTVGGTNIPRFTALAKGLSVTKPVVTPG